jgi:6-phosphogluconolactonase
LSTWSTHKDAQAAADACADAIVAVMEKALATRSVASLAVSGGSTPKLLFQNLAKRNLEWARIHIFWADERMVEPDHDDSNYRLTREHLLEAVNMPEENVHRVRGELSIEEAAQHYDRDLHSFFRGGAPIFDAIQLGMGPDGHTASLFPGHSLIEDRVNLVGAERESPKPPPERITLLPAVLASCRNLMFLVTGGDKAEKIQQALEDPQSPLPAAVVARLCESSHWFLDLPAAKWLSSNPKGL